MSNEFSTEAEQVSHSEPSFDLSTYLQDRSTKETFIMAEFGHDALPVAYRQTTPFTDDRAYIGFEAWMRDPEGKKQAYVQKTHEKYNGNAQNIHYQILALGGMVRAANDYGYDERWYEGAYDPTTPLPDATVEEVFLGNVFGDPYISDSRERTQALFNEVTRIVADEGIIVVRETITPTRTAMNFETAIKEHHLEVLARISPDDEEEWAALESQFSNDRTHTQGSFYVLLSKTTNKTAETYTSRA